MGIARAIKERIFDPFFTTKSDASQLGLGLTLAHRIVEAHQGAIRVESAEGKGASFTVVLPAAMGEAHLL